LKGQLIVSDNTPTTEIGVAEDWCGVSCHNWGRDGLIKELKRVAAYIQIGHLAYNANKPILECICPDGGYYAILTYADVPDHDVPCPCGNKKHWAIKYTYSNEEYVSLDNKQIDR